MCFVKVQTGGCGRVIRKKLFPIVGLIDKPHGVGNPSHNMSPAIVYIFSATLVQREYHDLFSVGKRQVTDGIRSHVQNVFTFTEINMRREAAFLQSQIRDLFALVANGYPGLVFVYVQRNGDGQPTMVIIFFIQFKSTKDTFAVFVKRKRTAVTGFMKIGEAIGLSGIPVFQIKDITGTLHIPYQIVKRDAEGVGKGTLMFLAQDRISGTLTDPLLISIEKKSLRETIGYTKPYHSDSKQTSQPSHILFFDKCVIRSIVQQKYEK